MGKRLFLYFALSFLSCFVGMSAVLSSEYALAGILTEVGMWLAGLVVVWYEWSLVRADNRGKLYDMLQLYVREKDEKGTARLLILADEHCYQGQGTGNLFGKRYVRISKKWVTHIYESPDMIEFIKCTICHELYHVKLQTPFFRGLFKSIFMETFSTGSARDKYYIESWKEELEADRYGCLLYGDKAMFIKKMEFMQDNSTYTHDKKKRTTHPSWDIRIKFIKQNIVPTLEMVTEEFETYYNAK